MLWKRFLRNVASLPAVVLVTACAHGSGVDGTPESSEPMQVVLAAMVGSIERLDTTRTVTSVDPRPTLLSSAPRPDDLIDGSAFRGAPAGLPHEREEHSRWYARELANRDIPQAHAFPMRENCTGIMAPPGYKVLEGCPQDPIATLVFGLPEQVGSNEWRVPMWRVAYGSGGGLIHTFSVTVVKRERGDFAVVELTLGAIIE